jgi:hypothetical protein
VITTAPTASRSPKDGRQLFEECGDDGCEAGVVEIGVVDAVATGAAGDGGGAGTPEGTPVGVVGGWEVDIPLRLTPGVYQRKSAR